MSAKDRHYKPRRFRDESDNTADKKLRGSVSSKKYMVQREEASDDLNNKAAREVKIPSRVRVPDDDIAVKSASKSPVTRAEKLIEDISAEKAAPAATDAPAEKPAETAKASENDTAAAKQPTEQSAAETAVKADVKTETPEEQPVAEKTAEATNEAKAPISDDDIDYVMPTHRSKKHKKHRSHSSDSDRSVTLAKSIDEVDPDYDEGYVFEEDDNPDKHTSLKQGKKKKRKKSKVKVVLISILCVILALIVGVVSTFFIMREIGRSKMHDYNKIDISAPSRDESGNAIDTLDATGRVIKYDGVSYEFNDNIMSVAFIGVDNGSRGEENLQMSDAIYILAIDTKTGSIKILGISRDTMADIDIYSSEGKFIDTEKRQMAYAHAYSGDGVTGGQNTLTSLSRLFYGLPLKDYFAINLDALHTLNDAIGGVTLTSSMTFVSADTGRTINEGETVTLSGKEAEQYIRNRDKSELESNNDRMQRQQEYIRAFISSIFPAAKKDISVVTNLYNAIKSNSDSTLDLTKITYIASTALSHMKNASDIQYLNLKGKITKGENAEMYPSNEETIRTMLDVFYKPIQFESIKETEK